MSDGDGDADATRIALREVGLVALPYGNDPTMQIRVACELLEYVDS